MKETRPYPDKPWIVLYTPGFWLSLIIPAFYRYEVDTSHPEWIEKVLKPAIEKAKKIKPFRCES